MAIPASEGRSHSGETPDRHPSATGCDRRAVPPQPASVSTCGKKRRRRRRRGSRGKLRTRVAKTRGHGGQRAILAGGWGVVAGPGPASIGARNGAKEEGGGRREGGRREEDGRDGGKEPSATAGASASWRGPRGREPARKASGVTPVVEAQGSGWGSRRVEEEGLEPDGGARLTS